MEQKKSPAGRQGGWLTPPLPELMVDPPSHERFGETRELREGGTARLAAGNPNPEIREPSGGGVNFGAWPGIWASEPWGKAENLKAES